MLFALLFLLSVMNTFSAAAAEESALPAFHPQTILLSPAGTLSFSRESVPEQAREAYLPPEYAKGFTSKESVLIYSIGMLLLFLVTEALFTADQYERAFSMV